MSKVLALLLLLGAVVLAVPHLDALTDAPAPMPAARDGQPGHGPRTVSLRADARGHFLVEATVNGRGMTMLADTGASAVVLTEEDARRAGFDHRRLTFDVPVRTANGESRAAGVSLDSVDIEGIRLDGVRALVVRSGDLETSLLGMSFIGRLSAFNMTGDRLDLVK